MLSPKESLICQLVAEGKPRKEIAHEAKMSIPGVAFNLRQLFTKLGVANNAELSAFCVARGWVKVERHLAEA